eukprot:4589875-Prorocentrum_lima.AAC.1
MTSSPRKPPGRQARWRTLPPVFLSPCCVMRGSCGSKGPVQERHVALRAPPTSYSQMAGFR